MVVWLGPMGELSRLRAREKDGRGRMEKASRGKVS